MTLKTERKTVALITVIVMCVMYIGFPFLQADASINSLYAQSAVLMDADSGRVLYGKDADKQMAMASTTKIMTLLIALEYGDLEDVITVSEYAAKMPDVQLNIREGEQYRLKDLLYSLMLESHNDSAVAIAEGIAGSIEKFADMMNAKAKEIGCENTCFITPNGLDATAVRTDQNGTETEVFHSTTAEDLAKIMSYCITRSSCKERFLEITQTPTYTFSNVEGTRTFTCQNHNAFLTMMDGAISGKTGFTGKAGYCYVGALQRDGKTLVVSLLACGWPNNKSYKWKDTRKLMEYGLENYHYADFETAIEKIPKEGMIPVVNGQTKRIGDAAYAEWVIESGRAGEPQGVLLKDDEEIRVNWNMEDSLRAPAEEGTVVGNVTCMLDGEVYLKRQMKIKHTVEEIDFEWCVDRILNKYFL